MATECGGCGGCGSDGEVNVASLSITHYCMRQIMGGHVPVDMTPQPCAHAQGPKKSTPHPSEHSARCIATSNTSLVHVTARTKRKAVLLAISAMMPSIVSLSSRQESTARGAMSPAKPALYVPLPMKRITVLLVNIGHDVWHHARQGKLQSTTLSTATWKSLWSPGPWGSTSVSRRERQ